MNTKHPLYKEKLAILREQYALEDIQNNQNWIELEKPFKDGYYKVWDLRDDIKNRDDAWVFYECIRLVGSKVWSRDKSFRKKIKKGKYEYVSPGFGDISEKTYESLEPAVQKYFYKLSYRDKNYSAYFVRYKCIVFSYYFVEKIKPRWVTRYKEIDSIIEAKINEKRDLLYNDKYYEVQIFGRGNCAPSWYCNSYNRSDRKNNKQTVQKNIVSGEDFDKYEYRYQHRHSARWDFW